ncbi:endonuclease [Paenibacillus swuensis]|uniref:Endonuclease n=1 Tax=Paenibacillus swuensis TaxID=1178515 RepID=A0A172TE74_9BACL|nr:Z1 domain-containing protein [Paenibacillus swuensis]ANE45252.1 endonuclease [Paenibacillus swuensis]
MNPNVQTLDKFIWAAINTKFPDTPPNEEDFMSEATTLRNTLNLLYPVSDDEFENVVKKLKSSLMIAMDVGVYISDEHSDHQSWLPGRRAETDFYYWQRYRRYLEDLKGWNTRVTSNLDIVSSEIVDLLGDPKNINSWQRRGLVLGDVQSGKTANYTAICNKAADTGYKVIIVLAGTMENLRMQTQERLDKEFAGRLSKDLLKIKGNREVKNVFDGVGKIDSTKRISAFTTVLFDFNSSILNSNDLTLKNINEPALFVVKKNKQILKNLESWLCSNNADQNGMIDLPLLIIDDEADSASVNTKKEDESPTAINSAIRSILKRFYRASYLGITATPFANIFINPETSEEMLGDDLFPRDFIYVLSPPTSYIGADALFGDEPKYYGSLIKIETDEIEDYLPFKHKKNHEVDLLPTSLHIAIGYFMLVNAIRDVRKDNNEHRSMLINVSRFTDVQVSVKENINVWIDQVKSDIRNYGGLDERQWDKIGSIVFLKNVWDEYELEKKCAVSWMLLIKEYLYKAISPIEVRAVNQKTGAASLNYYAYRDNGFRVIAVGGNSLSRGLTLEGLCVSYFYRNSQMYDTLLQMGRWFGYRPNYDDLFKVWMAKDAIDWYGYITSAANELKLEISKMNKYRQTPRDFGLKVRQDPNSLLVTARNKMRSGTSVSRPISVTGKVLETPRLKSKPEILHANEKAFKMFLASLDVTREVNSSPKGFLWRGVKKDLVVELLSSFDTHPWHLAFQGKALASYIDNKSELSSWDVILPSGSSDIELDLVDAIGNFSTKLQQRTVDESDGMLRISGTKVRVGSGGLTRAGLSLDRIKEIDKNFKANNPDKNVPDSEYLLEDRNPLLMLHIIESKKEGKNIPDILYAIGIGIPGIGNVETVNYMVNVVELRNWMDIDDDEDDDDGY